jgi:hypothetical protein
MPFLTKFTHTDENYRSRQYKIAILKTNDQFDVIRCAGTSGSNRGRTNKTIVNRLSIWDDKFGVEIIGADIDWIYLRFSGLVELEKSITDRNMSAKRFVSQDIYLLANEIYKFCPDIVWQGYAIPAERIARETLPFREDKQTVRKLALELLAKDIQKTRRVFLWWD